MRPSSRRRPLQLGGVGVVAAAVGGGTWVAIDAGRPPAGSDPHQATDPLVEPEVLASVAGRLSVRLEATAGPVRIGQRTVTVLRYNAGLPGPTLLLHPGDHLAITLVNSLTEPTNLHAHGLHVSPEAPGDDIFLAVPAGGTFAYEYQLPPDHPPRVFWYHPHHHGMVAEQVFGGLYGAIIVADPPSATPIAVNRERILVISDITIGASGGVATASAMQLSTGREGAQVLVNGQLDPVLLARPGQRERWRIINACTSRYLSLRLEGQQLQLLGLDSGRFTDPPPVTELLLAAGNRADLLVSTAAGTSTLQLVPYDRGAAMGASMSGMGSPSASTSTLGIATLSVTGTTAGPGVAAVPTQPPRRACGPNRYRGGGRSPSR